MSIPTIFESEYRFCLILWEHEPITSSELVKLCADQFKWKKSTTYTVIKRLSQRGVLKNENAIVTSLVSKDEVQKEESRKFIEKNFNGSLPSFIASFISSKALSYEEIAEIRTLIDKFEEK